MAEKSVWSRGKNSRWTMELRDADAGALYALAMDEIQSGWAEGFSVSWHS